MIVCPKCKSPLIKQEKSYSCHQGHSFDLSKEGYLNLLLANMQKANSGDNKTMVNSRTLFLSNHYYLPLAVFLSDLIKEKIKEDSNTIILDIGCGEGYYTEQIKNRVPSPSYIGIDISKEAIKKAAKRKEDILFLVANSSNMPLRSSSIFLAFSIFSPYFDQEFARILKRDGYLITISAGKEHLYQLKELLYEIPHIHDEIDYNLNSFVFLEKHHLKFDITPSNQDTIHLFQMTPYFYNTSNESKQKLNDGGITKITVHFIINIWKKR